MPRFKLNLTIDEILGKLDNIGEVASAARATVSAVKAAKEDGEVTEDEVLAIKAKAQAIVDAAQALADELVSDILD